MQMMPTFEELEEKIAIALCERDRGNGGCNIISNKGGEQDCVKVECYPAAYAKVTVQAMLSALPEPEPGYMNKHDMYYRQLLGMKR